MQQPISAKKILLVDNNKVILRLLSHMLENKGHEVQTAESGFSALEVLQSYRPDIIFVDLIMPNISGDVFCRIVRQREEFDNTLLVILSAVAAEEQVNFIDFGADACIAKGPAKVMEKHIDTIMDSIQRGDVFPISEEILGAEDVYKREITEELLAQKKHFEITLENMGAGFLELTWSAHIVYANATARFILNTSERDLLSTNFLDHFEKEQQEYIGDMLSKLRREPIEIGEDRMVVTNGKYILIKFVPLIAKGQKTIITLIHDVTHRKRTELKLLENLSHLEETVAQRTKAYKEVNTRLQEEIAERTRINNELESVARQWRTTFDTIPDFISVHDKDMKIIRANKALAAFLDKSPQELLHRTCYEAMHNTDCPWPNCPHKLAVAQKEVVTKEVDDAHIGLPLLVTCSPCYNEDGSLIGTVHIARDISEQKKIEAEQEALIRKLQNAYHIINESQIVACLWQNAEGWPLQFVSDNVEVLTGYAKDDFLSRKIVYSQLIHMDDLERVHDEVALYSGQQGKTSFSHEPYRIITKNNETKWISDRTEIRRDHSGKITHYQGLIEDITQKVQLELKEQELLVKKEQVKHLESLKTMAGAIAHRFNNAMTAVQGNLDLMTMTLPQDCKEYQMASDAVLAAKGASQIGSMMLTYIGQRPPRLQLENLVDIVGDVFAEYDNRIQTIKLEFDPSPGSLYCSMDKDQIKEVIGSVLTNAIESLNETSGTIKVSFGTDYFNTAELPIPFQDNSMTDGFYSYCQIKDTGHGIKQEELSRIFEPFFTTRFVGRGLGLALTVGIMKTHHGAITVESTPGKGTTFKILFPSATPQKTTPES